MIEVSIKKGQGKLSEEIQIGAHRLVSDVDTGTGGEDRGPSPHDLLAAALASCTAITLRMYAQRKSWPLEDAHIVVKLDDSNPDTMKFQRSVQLVGPLDETQKARLMEIANRCPVHRHLLGKSDIQTEEV